MSKLRPLLLALPLTFLFADRAPAEDAVDDPACQDLVRGQIQAEIDGHRARAQARRQQDLLRRRAEPIRLEEDDERSGGPRADAPADAKPMRPGVAAEAAPRATRPTSAPALAEVSTAAKKKPRPAPRRSRASGRSASTGDFARSGAAQAAKAKDEAGPRTYSRTNTQELAVDEGDIVKTDGRRIYHVSCRQRGHAARCRDEIRVYASWPPRRSGLLSRYRIPNRAGDHARFIRQLYLSGDRVVALLDGPRGTARAVVLDMRDPHAPMIDREVLVDGRFVESRMIGADLYLATVTPHVRAPHGMMAKVRAILAELPDEVYLHTPPTADDVLARLPPLSAESLNLPRVRQAFGAAPLSAPAPLYGCGGLHTGTAGASAQVLNLARIDLASEAAPRGGGVVGYGPQAKVYASEDAFYVATSSHHRGPGWAQATEIRKFRLERTGPRFVASGHVRGHLLNQFSMSEFEGHLRVATSEGWRNNGLYVLDERGGRLETIGSLQGFGRNERIYAVRMMGSKGYVVTFRRTDPLYTLDLTRPTNPRVVGELHIEGYSNYLHPLDDDHLLAIGQDATNRGQAIGFHMQIFDVRDPRQPKRLFHEKLEAGSVSGAQGDHHAFMFEPTTQTLSVPWKGSNYWGLIAYRVDTQRGFTKLGRVNHATMYKRWFQHTCRKVDRADCANKNHWWRFFQRPDLDVDRVVAIDGHLYSLSPSGLMVHKVGRRSLSRVRASLVSVPEWPSSARVRNQIVAARYRR